ncbi:hypothetical protein GEMRC1_005906 [Eukaryota sp. GEM-RC1]
MHHLYGYSISDSDSDRTWSEFLSDISEDEHVSDLDITAEDLAESDLPYSSVDRIRLLVCKSKFVWVFILLAVFASFVGIYLAVVLRSDPISIRDDDTTSPQITFSYPTTLSDNLVLRAPDDLEFVELVWTCDIAGLLEDYGLSSNQNPVLVVDGRSLLLNAHAVFSLRALGRDGSVYYCSVTFHLLKPANLSVSPPNGTSLTPFSFSLSNTSPYFLYEWFIVRGDKYLSLGAPSPKPTLITLLSPGYLGDKGRVTVICRTLDLNSMNVINERSIRLKVSVASSDIIQQKVLISELKQKYNPIVPAVYALSETLRHAGMYNDAAKTMRNHLRGLIYYQASHPMFLETLNSLTWTDHVTHQALDYDTLLSFVDSLELLFPITTPSIAVNLFNILDTALSSFSGSAYSRKLDLILATIIDISNSIGVTYSGKTFDIKCTSNIAKPRFPLVENGVGAIYTSSNSSCLCAVVLKKKRNLLLDPTISTFVFNSNNLFGGPLVKIEFPKGDPISDHKNFVLFGMLLQMFGHTHL